MILHAMVLTVKINEKPTAQNSVPWLRGWYKIFVGRNAA